MPDVFGMFAEPVRVAPGQTLSWWRETNEDWRKPDFRYENRTSGFAYVYGDGSVSMVPPGFERVAEDRLRQFARTGVYLSPFSKLSAADARALVHAVQDPPKRAEPPPEGPGLYTPVWP